MFTYLMGYIFHTDAGGKKGNYYDIVKKQHALKIYLRFQKFVMINSRGVGVWVEWPFYIIICLRLIHVEINRYEKVENFRPNKSFQIC